MTGTCDIDNVAMLSRDSRIYEWLTSKITLVLTEMEARCFDYNLDAAVLLSYLGRMVPWGWLAQ